MYSSIMYSISKKITKFLKMYRAQGCFLLGQGSSLQKRCYEPASDIIDMSMHAYNFTRLNVKQNRFMLCLHKGEAWPFFIFYCTLVFECSSLKGRSLLHAYCIILNYYHEIGTIECTD